MHYSVIYNSRSDQIVVQLSVTEYYTSAISQFYNGTILKNKHEILSLKWRAISQKALKQTQQGPGNQLKVHFSAQF